MKYSNEFVNQLIDQEIKFSDELATTYNYPDNITHLLYIIIPAFILKYGTSNRTLIEKCFSDISIIIDDKQDQVYQAYYFSKPKRINEEIITTKGIILNNYKNIGLMQLLDNLVHEFNHAINSLQNEITIKDYVMIRTGLIYNYYDKKNLSFIKKGEEVVLEEVINTRQTELIVDIIKNFSQYNINNTTVLNTLYSINHSIDNNYKSNSYLLESMVCQELLNNKTFISTLEITRFDGQIDDIHHFFDSIIGKDGTLLELSRYLNLSLKLQKELNNTKFFRKSKINKIMEINKKTLEIVRKFNQYTIYK